VLQFLSDYQGGLGLGEGKPRREYFEITLDDRAGEQMVYFYETLFCKGIRLKVTDSYPGFKNSVSLDNIIFYTIK